MLKLKSVTILPSFHIVFSSAVLLLSSTRPMDVMGIVTRNPRVHSIQTALFYTVQYTFLYNTCANVSSRNVCSHPDLAVQKPYGTSLNQNYTF